MKPAIWAGWWMRGGECDEIGKKLNLGILI